MVSLNHMKPDNRRDTLGRRPRDRRISTGKRVTPQERDLIWFQKLHEHGPLSSSYLHAFTKHLRSSEKRARDRLTDLFNESNTPHKGAYLERPWQQFQTYDARYQELVYDLAPAGEKALKQAGLWHTYGHVATGPWVHKYMVACITASIELETLENPNLTYIPGSTILERAGTTLRYDVPFINPVTGYEQTVDLIPDALFGLEYNTRGKKSYRFFLVEADRGSEPSRSSRFNRKSHMRNFLQYREYVGHGCYKDHLGLTAGMLVLNVANSEATLNKMLELMKETSPRGNSYMLFQAIDGFGRYFKPSGSHSALCKARWARVGARPMVISIA
jgi:hypothetical protein